MLTDARFYAECKLVVLIVSLVFVTVTCPNELNLVLLITKLAVSSPSNFLGSVFFVLYLFLCKTTGPYDRAYFISV